MPFYTPLAGGNPAAKVNHVIWKAPSQWHARIREPSPEVPAPHRKTCDEIALTSRFTCDMLFFSLLHHFTSSSIHLLWYDLAFIAFLITSVFKQAI